MVLLQFLDDDTCLNTDLAPMWTTGDAVEHLWRMSRSASRLKHALHGLTIAPMR